jgi:FAD/FMN-containing dehydrogenase
MDELVQWLNEQLDADYAAAGRVAESGNVGVWSPGQVQREIDAKRRILAECAHWHGKLAKEVVNPSPVPFPALGEVLDAVTPILRALALPYADRPGYREEWRDG